MIRRVLLVVFSSGVALLLLSARTNATADSAFAQIDSIVKSLSEISGFSEKHPVPYGRMTKRQLPQFLN